jgi:hypothetical protein
MLNTIGYDGPISVEWEDAGMDRLHGAAEAVGFVRSQRFDPPGHFVRRRLRQSLSLLRESRLAPRR